MPGPEEFATASVFIPRPIGWEVLSFNGGGVRPCWSFESSAILKISSFAGSWVDDGKPVSSEVCFSGLSDCVASSFIVDLSPASVVVASPFRSSSSSGIGSTSSTIGTGFSNASRFARKPSRSLNRTDFARSYMFCQRAASSAHIHSYDITLHFIKGQVKVLNGARNCRGESGLCIGKRLSSLLVRRSKSFPGFYELDLS